MTPHTDLPHVKQITATQLQALRASGTVFELLDVRTAGERAIACIAGARHLTQQTVAELQALPRDTPLVFQCHHGIRSQAAAQHFLALGFTDVSNLIGGIEAWSLDVDPEVPRY
jgi:monothiol glutaredoxin